MTKPKPEKRIARLGARIAAACVHRPALTISAFLCAALISAAVAAFQLRVDTDPSLMISNDLPASSAYYKRPRKTD